MEPILIKGNYKGVILKSIAMRSVTNRAQLEMLGYVKTYRNERVPYNNWRPLILKYSTWIKTNEDYDETMRVLNSHDLLQQGDGRETYGFMYRESCKSKDTYDYFVFPPPLLVDKSLDFKQTKVVAYLFPFLNPPEDKKDKRCYPTDEDIINKCDIGEEDLEPAIQNMGRYIIRIPDNNLTGRQFVFSYGRV